MKNILRALFTRDTPSKESSSETISILSKRGYEALEAGDYKQAISFWSAILESDASNEEAYVAASSIDKTDRCRT
jgi:cytochrome c-type biogenesis protein CcmH/NrfG